MDGLAYVNIIILPPPKQTFYNLRSRGHGLALSVILSGVHAQKLSAPYAIHEGLHVLLPPAIEMC